MEGVGWVDHHLGDHRDDVLLELCLVKGVREALAYHIAHRALGIRHYDIEGRGRHLARGGFMANEVNSDLGPVAV